ncbi:MAG: COG2426 family protein [Christensenellales bacterium]
MPTITIYLTVFALSMVPVIELRGAIPVGVLNGMNYWVSYAIAVLGSTVVVPVIIKFVRPVLGYLKNTRYGKRFASWIDQKAQKKKIKVESHKFLKVGLFIFVAIPLPGTGAWTGSLIAAVLNMRIRDALPPIFFGNVVAGAIMVVLSYYLHVIVL